MGVCELDLHRTRVVYLNFGCGFCMVWRVSIGVCWMRYGRSLAITGPYPRRSWRPAAYILIAFSSDKTCHRPSPDGGWRGSIHKTDQSKLKNHKSWSHCVWLKGILWVLFVVPADTRPTWSASHSSIKLSLTQEAKGRRKDRLLFPNIFISQQK